MEETLLRSGHAGAWLTGRVELSIDAGDVSLPATLDAPPGGPARGAVVVLHGSAAPQRSSLLYEHLARELLQIGVAVLRFDRRPRAQGDVPFAVQADDAVAAVAQLRHRIGDVPVGLWGWSQGTWPASAVAARRPDLIAFHQPRLHGDAARLDRRANQAQTTARFEVRAAGLSGPGWPAGQAETGRSPP